MKIKHHLLVIFAALVLAGCYDDDKLWNAVNEQEQRIEALEGWQKLVNNNIEALQILVSGKHYITAVTPVTLEGKTVGYTISFNDHDPITIYNGDKGDKGDQGPAGSTPVISIVQQPDGNWYWTLNGELIKDAKGNSIRANGQDGADGQPGQSAPVPLLKTGQQLIADEPGGTWTADAVYLSVDNGKSWQQVSGKNGADGNDGIDGDSMFASVDNTSNENYVIFTLANGGGIIKVPKYKGASLQLLIPDNRPLSSGEKRPWSAPWELGESFAIPCVITYPEGSEHHIEIIPPKGWKVEMDETKKTLEVTAPELIDLSIADYEGKLVVMLNVDDDPSIIRTVDLKLTDNFLFVTGGDIANLLNRYGYKGTSLTARGLVINQADYDALRTNSTIQALDLSGMMSEEIQRPVTDAYYAIPQNAFHSNKTLRTIKLPKTLKSIGDSAFCRCESLIEIEIPEKVTVIPRRAFYRCSSLRKVTFPAGLKRIEGRESLTDKESSESSEMFLGAFVECEMLVDLEIPSSCESIGAGAFYMTGRNNHVSTEYTLTIPDNVVLYNISFMRHNMNILYLNTDKGNEYTFGSIKIKPEQVFYDCPSLRKVIIKEGLTKSPGTQEDFRLCPELETVMLPSTFTTIHVGMFAECEKLKSIYWPIKDISNIKIETGKITVYDVNGMHTEEVNPFWKTNNDFKIYVPAQFIATLESKYSYLKGHLAPHP